MNKFILLFLFIIPATAVAQRDETGFFSEAQQFFSKYVKNRKVNYEGVKKDTAFTNKLAEEIKSFNLLKAGRQTRKAFYLNAYNILVIKTIAETYPVRSASDVKGLFETKHEIAGEHINLNEVEKIKLESEYRDPRIHFWLNPAAAGSPSLSNEAILPWTLEQLLDRKTSEAVNNKEFIYTDSKNKEVLLSMFFKFYEYDFTGEGKTVVDFINVYKKNKINPGYSLSYYVFNTDLNDQKKAKEEAVTLTKKTIKEPEQEKPAVKDSVIEQPAAAKEIADTSDQKSEAISVGDTPEAPFLVPQFDDILSEGSNMLTTAFQIRVLGALATQQANYNGEWNRVNSDYRSSNFNVNVQW